MLTTDQQKMKQKQAMQSPHRETVCGSGGEPVTSFLTRNASLILSCHFPCLSVMRWILLYVIFTTPLTVKLFTCEAFELRCFFLLLSYTETSVTSVNTGCMTQSLWRSWWTCPTHTNTDTLFCVVCKHVGYP